MGSVGQARGILQALENEYGVVEKKVVYNRWSCLPNCLLGATLLGVNTKESSDFNAPYPDIILSISRRTTPLARYLKRQSKGKSKIVQLMYPGRCGLSELDLVIVPEHDRQHAGCSNIFRIVGCPHRVSVKAMEEAKFKWASVFADLPRPYTSVIVGGAIKGKPFTAENAALLAKELRELKQKIGGSVLITSSRRTGAEAEKIIMDALDGIPSYTYLWGEKKENPIMGFWALGDQIVVTGDTVSMCSESCGSGNPVWIFTGKNWLTPKHHRFVQSLYDGGYAVALEDANALSFQPKERLDPSAVIADKIKSLF